MGRSERLQTNYASCQARRGEFSAELPPEVDLPPKKRPDSGEQQHGLVARSTGRCSEQDPAGILAGIIGDVSSVCQHQNSQRLQEPNCYPEGDTGEFTEIAPGGEIKHGGMREKTCSYSVGSFEKMLSVDRRDIVNEDLGVFEQTA